ncbi:hypothetical protein F5Y18DRAFT_383865 [Xylariaceae sp. FL1019]|nr:hypothetical protein F5Y18DRAFT_383865 [Xylariaceae sp. FL1019]
MAPFDSVIFYRRSQAQERQAQESHQSGPWRPPQPSYRFGRWVLFRLRERLLSSPRVSHLDDRALAAMRIRCQDMDFVNPKPPTQDPNALLQLKSSEEMDKLAEKHDFSSLEGLCEGDEPDDNIPATHRVIQFLAECVSSIPNPDNTWDLCSLQPEEHRSLTISRHDINRHWTVDSVLETKMQSHLKTFLAAEDPIRDDSLMLSEVWTILGLAYYYFRRPNNAEYPHIPVTVISGSGRYFRVVQGWADGENKVVNIRKTKLVHLGEEEIPNVDSEPMRKIMTLVRWLNAEPIPGRPS